MDIQKKKNQGRRGFCSRVTEVENLMEWLDMWLETLVGI